MEDPLWTVVNPPQARRLRERLGLEPLEPVHLRMRGWSKRVVLTDDRALLFPRDHLNVEHLRNEARALRAVAHADAPVPRLVEWIDDPDVSPYPILVVARLAGEPLEADLPAWNADALGQVLDDVARAAAAWHGVDPGEVASVVHQPVDMGIVGLFVSDGTPADIAERLGVEAQPAWSDALDFLRTLPPVLLHSDLHEAQLLVAEGQLTGIIDWQTAGMGHPYLDFRFNNWGTCIWRQHRDAIAPFRQRQWTTYAKLRALDEDHVKTFEWMWAADHLASGTFSDGAREEFDAACELL